MNKKRRRDMDLNLKNSVLRDAVFLSLEEESGIVEFEAVGGGITLSGIKNSGKRYIIGDIEVQEDHSVAMMFRFYIPGAKKERIFMRFGLLPKFKTRICLNLNWLDNSTIYTNRTPGTLKLVIHGQRTDLGEVERFELGIEETFHKVKVKLDNFFVTDDKPEVFPIPQTKLVDEFGQWKGKDWPGKIHTFEELKDKLKINEGKAEYPFPHWNQWGGDSDRKLKEGTGFFSTFKSADGRWHLADPDGCEYFSLGPCGTNPGDQCRVDSFEPVCDWLPDTEASEYKELYRIGTRQRTAYMPVDSYKTISYTALNLKRVYGEKWREKWEELSYHILMKNGINSQGNFPGLGINNGSSRLPYVRELSDFPSTDIFIFRDFPDVLSPEYSRKSEKYAKKLLEWKEDTWLIGYFLRNEPEFNFVENLSIADEVLHNPAQTYCRQGLIQYLKDIYQSIEALNEAWDADFESFEEFYKPIGCCSKTYPKSQKEIQGFSEYLIREYSKIPSMACKKADGNHLNLGLRWSKANNTLMMAGWEYFDVFSINCYDFNPLKDMDFAMNAGVDLPILLGEYHCGALDRGLTATGLKGVLNQEERGVMWRYFVERAAAHPYGVGAHWFQYNDQFCLGRYDGENYQIGMVDICMQPYKELMEAVHETSEVLYKVKNGEQAPYSREPKAIPMIGY
jgi:hypothetical protein